MTSVPRCPEAPRVSPGVRSDGGPQRTQTHWGIAVLFCVVAGVTLFFKLGDFRTLGSHEAYAIVPAREMMQSGDWVVPTYGGLPRLRKPPLVYWMLAAIGSLCGELNATIARIPAAVSALLLAILMGIWARWWYGPNAGWAAAFVQLTVVYALIYARKAEIDMMLWLFIAAALFLVAHQPEDEPRGRNFLRWTAITALIAVSWLAKFHYGPVMIAAPVVVYFVVQKRVRELLRFFNPVGLILIAAAVLIWPWMVLQEIPDGWNIWYVETVGRAVGQKGYDHFWYYVPVVFLFTLPWSPFAVLQARRSWQAAWKRGDARERFLWTWFLTHFTIVTLQANKHVHYIDSALPVVGLLAAQRLGMIIERIRNGSVQPSRLRAVMISIATIMGMAVTAAITIRKWPHLVTPLLVTVLIIGVGVPLLCAFSIMRRHKLAGLTAVCTFLGAFVVIHGWIVPQRDHRLGTVLFAQKTRRNLGTHTPVFVYRMGEHPVVYYLDEPLQRIQSTDDLNAAVRKHGRAYVVTYNVLYEEFDDLPHKQIVSRMTPHPERPDPRHFPLILVEFRSPEAARRLARR